MTERREAVRRPARAPLPRRSRKRWAAAVGASASWVILLGMTGSAIGATVALAVLAVLAVATVLLLRSLGVTRDHPWIRQLAARPWRDGDDVLHLALRHVSEVFVVTPSGSLLAPNLVELRLNPDDLGSLCERMDLGLIAASAAEVYQEEVAAHGARFAGNGPADVRVIADPAVPPGRYQLRQGQPVNASPQLVPDFAPPVLQPAWAGSQPGRDGQYRDGQYRDGQYRDGQYQGFEGHDGGTHAEPEPGRSAFPGMPTVLERSLSQVPVLRLVTGGAVAETRMSGARAGRGAVELGLPEVPTVSREHARFTFSDGQWWIANLGMNGLTLNDAAVVGEQPLSTGDSIRWGTRPDALLSRVEIG